MDDIGSATQHTPAGSLLTTKQSPYLGIASLSTSLVPEPLLNSSPRSTNRAPPPHHVTLQRLHPPRPFTMVPTCLNRMYPSLLFKPLNKYIKGCPGWGDGCDPTWGWGAFSRHHSSPGIIPACPFPAHSSMGRPLDPEKGPQ